MYFILKLKYRLLLIIKKFFKKTYIFFPVPTSLSEMCVFETDLSNGNDNQLQTNVYFIKSASDGNSTRKN